MIAEIYFSDNLCCVKYWLWEEPHPKCDEQNNFQRENSSKKSIFGIF